MSAETCCLIVNRRGQNVVFKGRSLGDVGYLLPTHYAKESSQHFEPHSCKITITIKQVPTKLVKKEANRYGRLVCHGNQQSIAVETSDFVLEFDTLTRQYPLGLEIFSDDQSSAKFRFWLLWDSTRDTKSSMSYDLPDEENMKQLLHTSVLDHTSIKQIMLEPTETWSLLYLREIQLKLAVEANRIEEECRAIESSLQRGSDGLQLSKDYQEIRKKPSIYAAAGLKAVNNQDIQDMTLGHHSVRVFHPTSPSSGDCLVYFHGGGFVFGTANGDDGLLSKICQGAQYVVISVAYPLAPEHPYPAPVTCGLEVLSWLREHGEADLGIDPSSISVMGISAGATIAADSFLQDALMQCQPPLKASILWSPMLSWKAGSHDPFRKGNFIGLNSEKSFLYQQMAFSEEKRPSLLEHDTLCQLSRRRMGSTILYSPESDCLHLEGLMFAQDLRSIGQEVEIRLYPNVPHHGIDIAGSFWPGQAAVTNIQLDLLRLKGRDTSFASSVLL